MLTKAGKTFCEHYVIVSNNMFIRHGTYGPARL